MGGPKANMVPTWTSFMDEYKIIAAASDNVWFIDVREDADLGMSSPDLKWYANDKSHPSPMSGTKFGQDVAALIVGNTLGGASSTTTSANAGDSSIPGGSSGTSNPAAQSPSNANIANCRRSL